MEQEELIQTSGEEIPVTDAGTEGESSTPEQDAAGEEVTADSESFQPEKKGGVQKRIDELVRQREDERREAEYWRSKALQSQPSGPETKKPVSYPDLPEPKSDQFETYDDYVDARADWRSKVNMRQFQSDYQAQTKSQTINNWLDSGGSKHSDFKEVFHPNLPVSDTMTEVLLDSPQGHDLAYYLGKNPDEARRIANLPAHRQAYEMGKIEAKISPPRQKTKTNAPTPTSPVGGKEMPTASLDKLSTEDFMKFRDQQEFGRK